MPLFKMSLYAESPEMIYLIKAFYSNRHLGLFIEVECKVYMYVLHYKYDNFAYVSKCIQNIAMFISLTDGVHLQLVFINAQLHFIYIAPLINIIVSPL